MSIFTDKLVEIEGVQYRYTIQMHRKVNKLANRFYMMNGYIGRDDFEWIESSHPQERLMYSMALQAFIFNGKIKPRKYNLDI